MEHKQEFLITWVTRGILRRYSGPGGDVTIPEGVTKIGEAAFARCDSLTSVTISEGVTEIGEFAFLDCTNLTNVTFPEGIAVIGERAFLGCGELKSVTVPQDTEIAPWAFIGCNGLADEQGMIIVNGILFDYVGPGGDVTIPENVVRIEIDSFARCDSLTSVTIPEGVTEIGERAFDGCTNLTSVTILESDIFIGDAAFADCENLTNLSIPDSVTEIGEDAFIGCTGLADEQGEIIVNGILFDDNDPDAD